MIKNTNKRLRKGLVVSILSEEEKQKKRECCRKRHKNLSETEEITS